MKEIQQSNQIQKIDIRQKLREAIRLQEIESNPLSAEEIEMFEMFEREGWPDVKCREYILKQFQDKYCNQSSNNDTAE